MFQFIITLFTLVFASLNLTVLESNKTIFSSDSCDESVESSHKCKTSSSSSKKKKPKRNRSAFIIFSSEMRAKLKNDQFEKLNSNEMMVRLAELWKNLAENEKKKYYDQADQEKARYTAELNTFYQKNPYEVIQNKTKKNHIKKPCSAYAIYLKETKKEIKQDHPDLKMADILKIVAERWKHLSEDKRVIFQKKALVEKEQTKAKLNQQQHEEEALRKDANKKGSPSSKKSPKAGEQVKIENTDVKLESSLYEPTTIKHQMIDLNMTAPYIPAWQQNFYDFSRYVPSNFEHEFNSMLDFGMISQNFKMPSFELNQFQRPQESGSISNLLSYLPSTFLQRAQPEFIDTRSFVEKESSFFVKDEEDQYYNKEVDPSTATELTPSHWPSSSRSQILNDCITSSLDEDFRLDDNEFEVFESGSKFKRNEEEFVSFM